MANDFDWNDTNTHVLRSYGDIAIYANDKGDIVLRQANTLGEEDSVVIVPRQQSAWVIAVIEDELRKSAAADALPGSGVTT